MKRARAADWWRRISEGRSPAIRLDLSCINVVNLPAETLSITGPVSVITGLNGAGKSTLMKAIFLALRRPCGDEIPEAFKNGCIVKVRGSFGEKIVRSTVAMRDDDIKVVPAILPMDATYIDPSLEAPALIRLFSRQKNLEELLQQSPQKELSDTELALVSSIIGKDYQRCRIYEVEDLEGRSTVPYFVVQIHNQVYGLASMGIGELALHFAIWHLSRVPKNSLILFEEPESYVSVRSQEALMDYLAQVVIQSQSAAIISTHSPIIFDRIPPEHTIILYRDKSVFRGAVAATKQMRLLALGIEPYLEATLDRIILVEDWMGKSMCHHLITNFDKQLFSRAELVIAPQGASQITSIVPKFPEARIRVIGLLDGDQKGKHDAHDNVTFLPGDASPEILLRATILKSPLKVAEQLQVDPHTFGIVLAAIEGMDSHDWFHDLHARLGVTSEVLFAIAFKEWVTDNYETAKQSFDALHSAVAT